MDLPPNVRSFALPPHQHGLALPQQRGLALQRPGWPAKATPPDDHVHHHAQAGKAGQTFEAMILTQLLATSRKASLGEALAGDTPLTAGQGLIHEQTDRLRAEAIARAAPLGVARLIENTSKTSKAE